MFDGKEKRLALIDELLIVASTEKINEQQEQKLVQIKENQQHKQAVKKGIVGKLVTKRIISVNQKRLKAQQINQMIHFMENAQKQRKLRENRETGIRQAEQVLKNREDKLYREIMGVHQNTVGNYKSMSY